MSWFGSSSQKPIYFANGFLYVENGNGSDDVARKGDELGEYVSGKIKYYQGLTDGNDDIDHSDNYKALVTFRNEKGKQKTYDIDLKNFTPFLI